MSARELIVLGTASQVPTRERNHNGYLVRWDHDVILFDPGEGTQRQLSIAGQSPSAITRICLTHFHGDHCLGLPGVLLRLSLDRVTHPVHLHYPASGEAHLQRLRNASIGRDTVDVRHHPVHEPGTVYDGSDYRLSCARLDHVVDAIGWRIEEAPGRTMIPELLAAHGVHGADIATLRESGYLERDGHVISLGDVSRPRVPQSVAFIMDTRWCRGALELADGADLVVCEATFLERDAELAALSGHLTARQAGRLAAQAGARRLVITHFSQRYGSVDELGDEAAREFGDVVVANDFDRIAVPARRDGLSPDRNRTGSATADVR